MSQTMMKCGCAANALRTMPDGTKVPSCVIHECVETIEPPNLDGRIARCYCGNTRPSSLDLAFFEYRGPGSRESIERCKCGFFWIAHQPKWRVEIEVDQKWYEWPRAKTINKQDFHAPRGQESQYAEREASFWRDRIGHEGNKKTPIFGVEIKSVKEITSDMKCNKFQPIGPQDDKFYCGCNGWD